MKAVIFDFFGVISSEVAPRWFRKYFSDEHSQELKEQYFKPADLGNVTSEEIFLSLGELVEEDPENVKKDFEDLAQINADLINYIRELKTKYTIGLCSNSMSEFIRWIIETNRLEELFDGVVISSEHNLAKPDEKIYQLILNKLNTNAKDAVFIDDNPKNLVPAERLGMKTLLFVNTSILKQELGKLGIII